MYIFDLATVAAVTDVGVSWEGHSSKTGASLLEDLPPGPSLDVDIEAYEASKETAETAAAERQNCTSVKTAAGGKEARR